MTLVYHNLMIQSDLLAFFFFLSFVIITFMFEYFLVLDYVFIKKSNSFLFDQQWKRLIHCFNAFFILHNVVGNLFQIIKVDSSIKNLFLSQIKTTSHWKYCSVCECLTPPRSFHCRQWYF